MNNTIVCKLKNKNMTISTMESCTGGMICDKITDIEGCSSVLVGGFVTYTNEQKIRCGVNKHMIDKFGVYSKETSFDMAVTVKHNTKSDIGIGVTGTLENVDKSNKDSKSGIVHFTIVILDKVFSYTLILHEEILSKSRHEEKEFVVKTIFETLNELLGE